MEYKLLDIKGVGGKVLKKLNNNQIYTPYQLLMRLPVSYKEYFRNKEISYKDNNNNVVLKALITTNPVLNNYGRTSLVTFDFIYNKQTITAVCFNQPYLAKNIKINENYIIAGKYNFSKNQVVVSKVIKEADLKEIEPKYNLEEISDKQFNKLVNEVIQSNKVLVYENIPNYLLDKYSLVKRFDAVKLLHNPSRFQDVEIAMKRMKYEEAYLFNKTFKSRVNVKEYQKPIEYNLEIVKELIKNIPYELTNDQKRVVNEIFTDFKQSHNTFRLIQGDVGSGKTVVSLLAILGMITANNQVAFMAPTELLARQQYEFFKRYLKDYRVSLLTSKSKDKKAVKEALSKGKIDLIVGTHAIASDDVEYHKLGLIIIDEQHKFGVNIRKSLSNKGNASLIYLTATPIPRTLAITLFGDALISSIKEKPANRKRVETIYINDTNLELIFNEIRETINKNEKVYIVVPAIDSEHSIYNIINMEKILNNHLFAEDLVVLHGKLHDDLKQEAIMNFLTGNKKILLATSMVEVGLDVKDATLMVIMNADFFGLSQLHQLRGRVGRSDLASKTILVGSGESKERLEILTKTDDGFILSEYDLKERGPGSLVGLEQSGKINFLNLDFIKDFEIIQLMHQEINKKY